MALPKINANPNYEVTIPSTGKNVTYRPYLVKEEKVLMIAFESGDVKHAMREIANTLNICINEHIDVNKLTTFDVEYLFTQIRSRSVGEVADVLIPCKSCDHKNEYRLDLAEVVVTDTAVDGNNTSISDDIVLDLVYPTYGEMSALKSLGDTGKSQMEDGFAMSVAAIKTIKTEDERHEAVDVSKKEMNEFVESMTSKQFTIITEFLQTIPVVTYNGQFECSSCTEHNDVQLRGLKDFL